jgi:alpha-tubulin suppressor-like RCC1 family protein
MNINNLQIQLQEAVNNAAAEATQDGTSSTLYYLQLAKAVQQLNMGQIRTVATVGSLPAAASNTGLLVFVTGEELLYFSDGTAWATIVPPVVYNNSIWGWGNNCNGSLGDNTTVSKSSPVSVVGGFTDWCQVASGEQFSLAVRTNGTLWAWGQANNGKLGNNTVAGNVSSPVSVVGGFCDWCQISAGASTGHSLAVRQNGTAWAWGFNDVGQLGDNTTAQKSSPVSVVGGYTDWCQISGGLAFSVALRQNGTAWAWGVNTGGRLGDNTTVNKSSPVSVVGGFCDWCQISAGNNFSLAVRTTGTAWAWGYGNYGRLGNNCTAARSSPVSVVGGFTDWCQVSAGTGHSLGLRTNSTLWAWGYGHQGQIGDNAGVVQRSSPVSVVGGFTDWCQASAGSNDSFGLRTNGTLWAWGAGSYGRLGDNTTVNKSSPVSVVGGFCDWFRIACSIKGNQTLAIRSTAT